jgi:hypothetical protein
VINSMQQVLLMLALSFIAFNCILCMFLFIWFLFYYLFMWYVS